MIQRFYFIQIRRKTTFLFLRYQFSFIIYRTFGIKHDKNNFSNCNNLVHKKVARGECSVEQAIQ